MIKVQGGQGLVTGGIGGRVDEWQSRARGTGAGESPSRFVDPLSFATSHSNLSLALSVATLYTPGRLALGLVTL